MKDCYLRYYTLNLDIRTNIDKRSIIIKIILNGNIKFYHKILKQHVLADSADSDQTVLQYDPSLHCLSSFAKNPPFIHTDGFVQNW